ncbi:MAG: SH3 domain-containing protein [Bdellovibrionales bacterium]|nr:SH3 domain-containing protein [Bdellovibrionales bacterium]
MVFGKRAFVAGLVLIGGSAAAATSALGRDVLPLSKLASLTALQPTSPSTTAARNGQRDLDSYELLETLARYEERILALEDPIPVQSSQSGDPAPSTEALQKLRSAVAEGEEDVDRFKRQQDKLIDQIILYRNRLREAQTQRSAYEEQIASLESRLSTQSEQRQAGQSESVQALKKQQAAYKKVKRERDKLIELATNLRTEVAGLKAGRDDDRKQLATENALLEKRLEALSLEQQKSARLLEEKTAALAELASKRAALDESLSESKGWIEELRQSESSLRKQLSESQAALDEKEREAATLKTQLNDIQERVASQRSEAAALDKRSSELASTLEKERETSQQLRAQVSDLKHALEESQSARVDAQRSVEAQRSRVEELQQSLAQAQSEAAKVEDLERALVSIKNELMLKETELAALSQGSAPTRGTASGLARTKLASPERESALTSETPVRADVLIAEVTAAKVNLRSGPGTEHSPVMQVKRGARLTIESKRGDWYRVLTPTGSRAYVHADVISISRQGGTNAPAAARPMAGSPAQPIAHSEDSSDIEARAFDLIKREIGNR